MWFSSTTLCCRRYYHAIIKCSSIRTAPNCHKLVTSSCSTMIPLVIYMTNFWISDDCEIKANLVNESFFFLTKA